MRRLSWSRAGNRSRANGVARAVACATPARLAREVLSLAVGIAVAAASADAQQGGAVRQRSAADDLQMFSQVFNHLRVNHPDSLDSHKLIAAAINGMLRAADPHSYVLTSYRLTPEKEADRRAGRLVNIPVAFSLRAGAPVVVSVVPGSAAARADVLPGDELIAIDGEPVIAESEMELDLALAGANRSSVRLTLERRRADGSLVQLERTVRRERVEDISAVPAAIMLDDSTGYVRVTSFENSDAARDVRSAMGRLERAGMRRLVLDLRDNPGGIVDQASRVAGEFLPKGAILYTQSGRKAQLTDTVRVERSFWSREKRLPVVVLVNEGSASASELVAGALQDHDRALIVGRPTFGKSLLMTGFPLSDGSVAVLVVGQVRTPCGRVVQREYRDLSTRDYYRLARAERDTAGRPSCTTTGGRRVYGGGGIVPDVILETPPPVPMWMSAIAEQMLPLQWVGGHVTERGDAYGDLDSFAKAPALAEGALASFKSFAASQGAAAPESAEADALLERRLVLQVAATRWGQEGYFRVAALLDPEVQRGIEAFAQAELLQAAGG
jgi:carboxyl-terminal processing protease